MTCCDYGTCTQGRDCPVRKQRMKETNDAYVNRKPDAHDPDPYIETLGTVKGLGALLVVTFGIVMVAKFLWWK